MQPSTVIVFYHRQEDGQKVHPLAGILDRFRVHKNALLLQESMQQ